MPAQIRISERDILKQALSLIRERGIDALNSRVLAQRLKCSTQPIYRTFGSMGNLLEALRREAAECHRSMVAAVVASGKCNLYQAYGIGFARFARQESELFKFLYLTPDEKGSFAIDVNLDEIIDAIVDEYGYDRSMAQKVHSYMTVYSYGLAINVALGLQHFSDEEIIKQLNIEFHAITKEFGQPPKGYFSA